MSQPGPARFRHQSETDWEQLEVIGEENLYLPQGGRGEREEEWEEVREGAEIEKKKHGCDLRSQVRISSTWTPAEEGGDGGGCCSLLLSVWTEVCPFEEEQKGS